MTGEPLAHMSIVSDIAAHIAESAIWHEGRCTWMGAMPEEGPGGIPNLTYRAFGPDLYGGTVGVGLFLAELVAISPEERARETAYGALRHAYARARQAGSVLGNGLYSGLVGIAYGLSRAGTVLGEPEFIEAARELGQAALSAKANEPPVECDLMSGLAGSLTGLLALGRILGEPIYTQRAADCADRIVANARRHEEALCWPSTMIAGAPALLGLSHGASGIAVALLEVARVTGEAGFKEAAAKGFEYERLLYDAKARNWPDLRNSSSLSGQPSFATYWCHGAPGVALARIRALELGGGESAHSEAQIALETTQASVRTALEVGQSNFSLCHGICGNAEVLAEGRQWLSGEGTRWAHEVAESGVRFYGGSAARWPCGTHGGSTPALFLGLAGVGHFYLRDAHPEIPSVLYIRP
jgi:lantibiotic biosynthesis protein